MTLENIIERIEKDAQNEATKIIEQAKEDVKSIVSNESKLLISRQNVQNQLAKEKAQLQLLAKIAQAKLEARNKILVTKKEMIDKVFDLALRKMNELEDDDYNNAVINLLITYAKDEESVVIKDGQQIVNKANELLQKNCSSASLTIDSQEINKKGFLLIDKQGPVTDYTFENLINYNKDILEQEVYALLVKEE